MRFALVVAALLAVPAMALGASISVTSGGAAAVDVEPGVPVSLAIEINLADMPAIGTWDAGLGASKDGFTLSGRTPASAFAGWWNLDFGAYAEPQAMPTPSLGYMKPTAGNVDFSGAALTFVLSGPALAADESVEISLVDPEGSAVFYGPGGGQIVLFDSKGALTITALPEPASLLLLGLGGLFLRRRR